MSRKYKTSKEKRTNYIYYGNGSSKTVLLRPGENGVTEILIETLHAFDDEEVDNNRRETRKHDSMDEVNDKAEMLIDHDADVEYGDTRGRFCCAVDNRPAH